MTFDDVTHLYKLYVKTLKPEPYKMFVSTMTLLLSYRQTVMMCSLLTTTAWAWIGGMRGEDKVMRWQHHQLFMSTGNLVTIPECLSTDQKLVFVDGTWFHKGDRNGRAEFEMGPRIQGAKYMDMSDISATKENFPELNPKGLLQMLPPEHLFASTMDMYGITNDDHVIVYAKDGALFTPRTWFLFRHMGHKKTSLLQGSLEEWIEAGGPIDTEPTAVPYAKDILAASTSDDEQPSYQVSKRANVVNMEGMMNAVTKGDAIILDPRGSSFAFGHIPGAIHIPYSSLVCQDNALKLKSREELEAIFEAAGVNVLTDQNIISTCGSGVSVCHIVLALEECGRMDNTFIYDGSWAEWGSDPDTPKVLPQQ